VNSPFAAMAPMAWHNQESTRGCIPPT
jgi:hypothetical protein